MSDELRSRIESAYLASVQMMIDPHEDDIDRVLATATHVGLKLMFDRMRSDEFFDPLGEDVAEELLRG